MTRLLVVTAVEAERAAVADALGQAADAAAADVVAVGVGPAAAAAGTSALLAAGGYDIVINAGIGGGFGPLVPGDIAVSSGIVFADLGAETPEFESAGSLGFGVDHYAVDNLLADRVAALTNAYLGTALTVATVTGTAATAAALLARHTGAVSEGMEGAGVAAAAAMHGIRVVEIRAISNPVGPRDRGAWRIPLALRALASALGAVGAGLVL
jgi:futalosine hydrolase